MRIAIIGAGSVGFTRKLVRDMLKMPELANAEFALHDISAQNLDLVRQILARDIEANGLPARLVASTDRRMALEGARYVISCVRVGGLGAFASDIEIPLRYGVDQWVRGWQPRRKPGPTSWPSRRRSRAAPVSRRSGLRAQA